MLPARSGEFVFEGQRLVFDEFGGDERPFILLPGLLLPRSMHRPLAEALAARGNRVITLDLLGHGESERPRDMWRYSMTLFAQQVVALIDHLDLDEVIVGGTSLGANVTLEVASAAPERLRGLVIEMPVLDNALVACAIVFSPLLIGLTLGEPIARLATRLVARLPRGLSQLTDVGLDWASQDPGPSSAVLQGLFFGRIAPPRTERRKIDVPALVIGHPRDPVHPFSDSGMLVRELRRGRLVEATSILELRLQPERLTAEIADFLDDCWRRAASRRRAARRRASSA
jgi:pimeloyl-ACP methyl ester carboxylesterase